MYSFTYWRTLWFLSSFTNYKQGCEKHPYSGFCVDICFQLVCNKIPRIIIAGLYDKTMFHFGKNLNCLPEWLYRFAFPPSLSAFGGVSVPDFGHFNRCILVSHCLNLYFCDDICWGASFHILICLFFFKF